MTSLVDVPLGVLLEVVRVADHQMVALARHGIVSGARLTCDQDAPLGGPRVVRLGDRRVSVPRVVCGAVEVRVVESGPVEVRVVDARVARAAAADR